MADAPTLFTCGHSTRPFEELVHLLQSNGITVLVDVRAVPKSRYYPQFNRSYLEAHLPIRYLWRGDKLGGKNASQIPPEAFAEGIDELTALAASERPCMMCSERSPTPTKWRKEGCHRWYSLTPAVEKKGVRVVHL